MRFLLATNHLFSWTGSEITLQVISKLVKSAGHEVLVFSPFVSTQTFLRDLLDDIPHTSSFEEVAQFAPDMAYTQHHTSATLVRSACPFVKIVHGVLGVMPHLEQPPRINIGISKYLAISEEVIALFKTKGRDCSNVILFRNIVDDSLFHGNGPIAELSSIACYSYKLSEQKYFMLENISKRLGVKIFDHRQEAGTIAYKSVPKMLLDSEIVVASGRGAIEAMLCGKVPLILSNCGDDGLVTPDNFELLMQVNFSGRMSGQEFNEDRIEHEIGLYRREYGPQIQAMALRYFGLSVREPEILRLFDEISYSEINTLSELEIQDIDFEAKTFLAAYSLSQYEFYWRNNRGQAPIITGDTYSLLESHKSPALHFAEDLANLGSLINRTLSGRDKTIALQSMQLNKMREELLRTEAQLDLLKDVMFGGR